MSDEVVFNEESQLDNVPKSVIKQGEAANKLMATEDPEPDTSINDGVGDVVDDVEPDIIDPPIPDEIEDVAHAIIDEDAYEHKFNTLQGKYDAETSRLKQVADRQQETIDQLLSKQDSVIVDDKPKPADLKSLNPDDYDDFDPFMKEVGQRVQTLEEENKGLKDKLSAQNETLSFFQREHVDNKQETFEGQLSEAVPDWKQINSRSDWKNWLVDPNFTESMGLSRDELIQNAVRANNTKPIIKFLNEWKGTKVPVKNNRTLADEVVPSSGTPAIAPKPGITRAEYKVAADKAMRGKITEAEFDKISYKFQNAIAAGEIR